MTSNMEHSRVVPEEILLLMHLNNISAMSPDRSLTIEEISIRTAIEHNDLMKDMLKLIRADYIHTFSFKGVRRYYLTENGIRKALSGHS